MNTTATVSSPANEETNASSAERNRRITQFTVPLFSGRKLTRVRRSPTRRPEITSITPCGGAPVPAVQAGVALQEDMTYNFYENVTLNFHLLLCMLIHV